MWGIWMLVILAFAGVALLGMALAVGAAPLLAILIFLVAAAVVGAGFVFKRGTEHVKDRDADLRGERVASSQAGRPRTPDAPKPTGKPVTGEGGDVA
jgi:membrane protein implicated in regulation of membrane protease activity